MTIGGDAKQIPDAYTPVSSGEKEEVVSLQQKVRRFAEVVLLLWAWLTSWWGIVSNSFMLSQKYEVEFLASLVVLVVGLLLTNVLGFLQFRQQRLWHEARLALVDLDAPYMVYKHGRQVVRGQDCPDYESTRLRNSLWRSLPLAMTTFILAFRAVLEIPACQAAATISALTIGIDPTHLKDSLWAKNLERDGFTSADISHVNIVKAVNSVAQNVSSELIEGSEGQFLLGFALQLEKKLWAAGHCTESNWEGVKLPNYQTVQNWIQGSVVELESDGELGGIGNGNLLAFNYVFWRQMMMAEAKKETTERLLRPAAQTMLQRNGLMLTSLGVRLVPWNDIVDAVEGLISFSRDSTMGQSVKSSRPTWVSMTLDGWEFWEWKIQGGWKLWLVQSFGLLLVAILPIRKKILAYCQATETIHIGLITLYTSIDILSLVTVWLLCAMKPVAQHLGNCAKQLIDSVWPIANATMQKMAAVSLEGWQQQMPEIVPKLMHETGENTFKIILTNIIPALTWDLPFFLQLSAGSLVFLAISGAIAYAFHRQLAASLCVGICGPLWLLAADDGTENSKIALSAFILLLSRSFLFVAIIMLTWGFVDCFSIELFFALICNQVYTVHTLGACLLGMLVMHFMLGLATIFLSYAHLEEKTPPAPSQSDFDYDSLSGLYGTFPHDHRQLP